MTPTTSPLLQRLPCLVGIALLAQGLAGMAGWGAAGAQEPDARSLLEDPARVMVLGTYHMANPGADAVNVEADDVTAPRRQRELEVLADRLQEFAPDRIGVELPSGYADSLAIWYDAYRAGDSLPMRTSELDQVSFRLASRLGHDAVYPIDYRMGLGIESVMEEAAELGMEDRLEAARRNTRALAAEMERIQSEGSVTDILRYLNSPAFEESHAFYMMAAPVGRGPDYPGVEMVARWYERNLRIFTNIWRLAQPGERILVVIGAGHGPLLKRFIRDSPELTLVDPLPYLAPER